MNNGTDHMTEPLQIRKLMARLNKSKIQSFPSQGQPISAPTAHGVYLIRDVAGRIVHVGRTVRGRAGLAQRLRNHLRGQSSFVIVFLKGDGDRLRRGFTYQYLVVPDARERAVTDRHIGARL